MKVIELKNNKPFKTYDDPSKVNGLDPKRMIELIHKLNSSAGDVVAINMGSRTRYFKSNIDRQVKKSQTTKKVDVTTNTDFYYCNYQKAGKVMKFSKEWGIEILSGTQVQSNHAMFSYVRSHNVNHQHGLRFVSKKTWVRMPKTDAGWGFRAIEEPCNYIDAMKDILKIAKFSYYTDDACLMFVFDTKNFHDMIDVVQEHMEAFYFVSKDYQHEDYNRVFFTPLPLWSPRQEQKKHNLERIVNEFKKMNIEYMGI